MKNNKNNELEKIGIKTSLIAINPVNSEPIPIWVASYVLDEYGTGAVMGCLLYTSPSPRDNGRSRMPSSA